ncbi:MAG TPA: efflux RND transporter permease subunit [Opitutaceae bacterium]|nr:efflux RND transporter permease subunit [Opitutaceae bacterium]
MSEKAPSSGGIAQYFVEHRGVAWLFMIAVLIWGWASFRQLPQQEDPKIPLRKAVVVTVFPGATADKVENLVTKPLEKKLAEQSTVDEISSESRNGLSVIKVALQPQSRARMDQDWDKLRAKIAEVPMPEGTLPTWLNSDFGDTVTLLYAIASEPITSAEVAARARLVESTVAELRAGRAATGRAAIALFYPEALGRDYLWPVVQRFIRAAGERRIAADLTVGERPGLFVAEFATDATREEINRALREFRREAYGSDGELHPDLQDPFVLLADEPAAPLIAARRIPRMTYRQLEKIAEDFEDSLRQVPDVGRTKRVATVPETVYLDYSTARLAELHVSAQDLAGAVARRNAVVPGGTYRTEGNAFPVQVTGEFANERELLDTVVATASDGTPTYLRDAVAVVRGYENPIGYNFAFFGREGERDEFQSRRAVLVSIEMREGAQIGGFYEEVKACLRSFETQLPGGVALEALSNQPESVRQRIGLFSASFAEAVVIVVLVALLLMDWRSAIVMALAIPLSVAMTFGGMHLLGIPLHQISIAGLIIALGMLVDVPVVVSDGINRELHHGEPRLRAGWLGPRRLSRAILFATLINVVAFLPLVLLPGDKGAFMYGMPMVVTLALLSALVVSVTFVPLLSYYLLKGQKGLDEGGEVRAFFLFRWVDQAINAVLPRYRRLLEGGLNHPWRTIGIVYTLFALSLCLSPFFGRQFFPPADRAQFLVDIELPRNAAPAQMRDTADRVAAIIAEENEVANFGVFYGGSAPRFYYNVEPKEPGAFLAQVVVNTRTAHIVPLLARLRGRFDAEVAGARVVAKQLEQGVPIDNPIQIRLSGPDLDVLRGLADQVSAIVRAHGGYKVTDDLGQRLPNLRIAIDQERANTLGVDNRSVGAVTAAAFFAARITQLREGDHLVPVNFRLRRDEIPDADRLRSLYVPSTRNGLVPLTNFASVEIAPAYATVPHFQQLCTVTVKSFGPVGMLPAAILAKCKPEIAKLALPAGYTLSYAGEDKELAKSQSEMGVVFAISLSAIFLAMVLQFGSVAKSVAVMITVPLGVIGAFAGIVLFQTNFGFMALLGLVSLAGLVVSHIIVLSDYIEEARAEGMALRDALIRAGLVRLRPVVVTVLAAVCGLIPLALHGGELWRPLTAVHIVGLTCATLVTLVVLPVFYLVFCEKLKWIK